MRIRLSAVWMIGCGLLSSGLAHAQTLAVPLDRATLAWDAPLVDLTHSAPQTYAADCGGAVVRVPATQTQVAIRDLVTGPGTYTCRVVAENPFGRSPDALSPSFEAGLPPNAIPAVRLEVR